MKCMYRLLLVVLICLLPLVAQGSDVVTEMDRVATEVARLKLGFGHYILGQPLTIEQQKFSTQHLETKSLEGTYKFRDGELFVVARSDNDVVMGIYKELREATAEQIKTLIGTLMLEFGEPTLLAHEKLIYWAFNENGQIEADAFKFSKQSGGADVLATVKFSSTERITSTGQDTNGDGSNKEPEKKPSIYVIISSDPLSKLFLAHTSQSK